MIFDLRVLGVWLRAALRSWYARTILTGLLPTLFMSLETLVVGV
jgi:hypothetical protein